MSDEKRDEHGPKGGEPDDGSWMHRFRELGVAAYVEKWRKRIRTHPVTGLPLTPARDWEESVSIERLAFSTGKGLRLALKVFAPAVFTLFVLSFFIEQPVMRQILRSCSIASLIGFGTNWIAIKMLFRPRTIRPVFGQGLIPAQRDELIHKVADEVIEKLINEEIIRKELEESELISRLIHETGAEVRRMVRDPEFVRDTKQLILTYAIRFTRSERFREELIGEVESRVEEITGRRFATGLVRGLRRVWRGPVVRVVDEEVDRLPETLDKLVGEIDEALDHVPAFLERKHEKLDAALTRVVMALIREMDVHRVVQKQLSTVTADQLEMGFREFADDKLSFITLLGGLVGFVGGFVIIWPLWSTAVIAFLLLSLAVLDVVAHAVLQASRRRRKERERVAASDARKEGGETREEAMETRRDGDAGSESAGGDGEEDRSGQGPRKDREVQENSHGVPGAGSSSPSPPEDAEKNL